MAKLQKTEKAGVYTRRVKKRYGDGFENVFIVRPWIDGKNVDVTIGRESEGWTATRAAKKKAAFESGTPLPQDEKKKQKSRKKPAKKEYKTIDEIWHLYQKEKGEYSAKQDDRTHYGRRLKPVFGNMRPMDITPEIWIQFKAELRDMKTIPRGPEMKLQAAIKWGDKNKIEEAQKAAIEQSKPLSKQTQYHVLGLIRKLCRWAENTFPDEPMARVKWEIDKPGKKKKEKLSLERIAELIDVCQKDKHPFAGKAVLLALFTGARKKEILNLRWEDIDFDNDQIFLGVNLETGTTKAGESDDTVPMNSAARDVLESMPRLHGSPWVFQSPVSNKPYTDLRKPLNDIKRRVGLPNHFRIMHGCRHIHGTIAAKLGGALATKELLRHKDISTSETYINIDQSHWGGISEKVVEIIKSQVGKTPPDNGGQVIKLRKK